MTLINGNAYELINSFIKKGIKFDHIITDPPYNISKENNLNTMSGNRQGVDFGEWDKDFDLISWISEYEKVLRKGGSFIVFGSYLYISDIVRAMESVGLQVKDILVWQKSNPMPRNIERRYVQDMEFAIWGVKKGDKWIFNKGNAPYRRGFFQSSTVSGHEKLGHPTQKSLKVISEIIDIHTNAGEHILDPFMGSGTTGEACKLLDRKFTGIELSKEYYEMAKKRLEKGVLI